MNLKLLSDLSDVLVDGHGSVLLEATPRSNLLKLVVVVVNFESDFFLFNYLSSSSENLLSHI